MMIKIAKRLNLLMVYYENNVKDEVEMMMAKVKQGKVKFESKYKTTFCQWLSFIWDLLIVRLWDR